MKRERERLRKKKKKEYSRSESEILLNWMIRSIQGIFNWTSYTKRSESSWDERLAPRPFYVNRLRDNRNDSTDVTQSGREFVLANKSIAANDLPSVVDEDWSIEFCRVSVSRIYKFSEGSTAIRGQYTTRPILYRFSLLYERNAKGASITASASS